MQLHKQHKYPGSYLARQRSKARALHGRVYATADGRLLLVRGKPDAEQMLRYLAHLDHSKSNCITPADLGVPRQAVDELTESQLVSSGHALTNWQRFLQPSGRGRHRPSRYRDDVCEVAALQERLRQLHRWKRLIRSQDIVGRSPWLLDDEQESHLSRIIRQAWDNGTPAPCFHRLARIVFWVAGGVATSRFCHAATFLASPSPESDSRRLLRATLAKLHIWQKRATLEPSRAIQQEMALWMSGLPTRIVTRAGLTAKLKGHTLADRLLQQSDVCRQALRECSDGRMHRLAAALATIVASDNATTPIPQRLVNYWIERDNDLEVRRTTRELLEESRRPGYDRLLGAIDQSAAPLLENFRFVRYQLSLSQRIDDIEWVVQNGLRQSLTGTKLPAGWVRSFHQQLEQAELGITNYQFVSILESCAELSNWAPLDEFVSWVISVPTAARTPRVSNLLRTTLLEVVLPAMTFHEVRRNLRRWRLLAAVPSGAKANCLESWSRHLQKLQSSMGQEPRTPATVRGLLEAKNSRHREHAYLARLERQGSANGQQLSRLRYLEKEAPTDISKETNKALRAMQDTFVHTALESIRLMVRSSAEAVLGNALSHRLKSASMHRVMQFTAWRRDMQTVEQQLFDQLMNAHKQHGSRYKRALPTNEKWLKAARSRGIDIEAWLQGERRVIDVADRRLTIDVSTDPMEVFLMGNYFGTCLSLGYANQMAVLANATDANKQVIYVRDHRQRVQARQLIAISDKFQLLGYYCYVNENTEAGEAYEQLVAAMARYCGQLARRCHLPLADEGTPKSLGQHFWYDDGTDTWHDAAHAAMHTPAPDSNPESSGYAMPGLPTADSTSPLQMAGWRD
ncbi:hypothetical protein NG895_29050 [Aeoliella sp. ICT_H6.2]|uniref:Uncharacterized protein n=1 Tax=Aeoliella straminimaris TaxID=2954799 RepID=A0A9X2JL33_9BACT|nr:hypothetical protein [Aeoliella straminimaris]MCO6047969.1 hypothetical protein [Aeoliella straminimaris]